MQKVKGSGRKQLWRLWLAWKFRLFQQHRHRRLALEYVDGIPLVILPDVFNPTLFHTSQALIRLLHMRSIHPGVAVLDMGTGSGIGAIAAARLGARVVAVDLSAEAARCASMNALLNRVEAQIDVRCGDLFEPIRGEQFDLVMFNPPFYAGVPGEIWEYAWRSEGVLVRFAQGLADVLAPGGHALVIVSTDTVGVQEALAEGHLQSRVLWEADMVSERLSVLEWTVVPEAVPS